MRTCDTLQLLPALLTYDNERAYHRGLRHDLVYHILCVYGHRISLEKFLQHLCYKIVRVAT